MSVLIRGTVGRSRGVRHRRREGASHMSVHPTALVAIILMAIVPYATRAGGCWNMLRITPSRRIAAMLAYLSGRS